MKKFGMIAEDKENQDHSYHWIQGQGFTGDLVAQTKKHSGLYYSKLKGSALHNMNNLTEKYTDITPEKEEEKTEKKYLSQNRRKSPRTSKKLVSSIWI